MTAWLNMPCDADTDWQELAFQRQFAIAYRERYWAITGLHGDEIAWSYFTMPVAGDDAHAAAGTAWSIAAMQNLIEGTADHWCPAGSHVGATARPAYTLASLRTAAGINASGFTKKYPREITTLSAPGSSGQRARLAWNSGAPITPPVPEYWTHNGTAWVAAANQTNPPDVIEDHGIAEAGDYIGPWLFNEVYACFQLMTCVSITASASGTYGDGTYKQGYNVSVDYPLAAAKADAVANWAAFGAPIDSSGPPYAWNEVSPNGGMTHFQVQANRVTAKFIIAPRHGSADAGNLNCDIDWYIVARAHRYGIPANTFAAQGDNVADGTATLMLSSSGLGAGELSYTSSQWPTSPDDMPITTWAAPVADGECAAGWETKSLFAVMDFGIDGGFEYV